MASGTRSSPPTFESAPTRNEMINLVDFFELKDVRTAIERYWPYDEEYFDRQNDQERETHERERLSKEIERLSKEIERLNCLNAKMLKTMQDMATKSEHAKAEMDEIVEALRAGPCQLSEHDKARQQAIFLQQFLG
ncbi:hypothetical protein BGX38DRAFT_1153785 [Terfezia claveryi]|nr:hypothetical protein BGX38DRAFT_1153785 [Terfezia claveryi]